MEIRQIKYFIQICNDKSFSKAAENLHISQQGLSKTIKNLEDELGSLLFDRSSKGVKPTEFGNLLLEKSRKVVNEFELLVDFLYGKAEFKKEAISIGLPCSVNAFFFADMICEYQDKYPDIKLEIIESGAYVCEKKVEDNLLDVSFAIKPVDTKKFRFIPIFTCEMMLLVNKDNILAQKNAVKFKDLESEKFIMLSPEYKMRQLTIDCCSQAGFKPNIVFTTSQLELLIELVALNKGIAVLTKTNLLKATKVYSKVSAVSFEDMPFKFEAGIIVNKYKKLNYVTNTLIDYALNFYKDKKLV